MTPIFNPNGPNLQETEDLICAFSRALEYSITPEITACTIRMIREFKMGYEEQSGKQYDGFLPEQMRIDNIVPFRIPEVEEDENLENFILAHKITEAGERVELVLKRKDWAGFNFFEGNNYVRIVLGTQEFEDYERGTSEENKTGMPSIEVYYFDNEEGVSEIFRYKWVY